MPAPAWSLRPVPSNQRFGPVPRARVSQADASLVPDPRRYGGSGILYRLRSGHGFRSGDEQLHHLLALRGRPAGGSIARRSRRRAPGAVDTGREARPARRRHPVLGRDRRHERQRLQPDADSDGPRRPPRDPRAAVLGRPPGGGHGALHRVSRLHGPGGDLGSRAGRKSRYRHRPRRTGPGSELLRRRVHQPAPPSGLGTGAGVLRRGSAPPRRNGGGAGPRCPAQHDGGGQALRPQFHGERAVHRGRDRRRRPRSTRCSWPTSAEWSTRASTGS